MLYKRDTSQFWYVKFKYKGQVIRKSAGTDDREKALAFEEQLRRTHLGNAQPHHLRKGRCFVYLICPEETHAPVKIGISRRPKGRLGGLQTSHYEKLMIFAEIPLENTMIAAWVEAEAHKQLAEARIRGEWFDIEAQLAEEIVLRLAANARAA